MNLRVDLILENEQRSASVVSMKFMLRLGAFLVPTLLVLLAVAFVFHVMRLGSQLTQLEQEWEILEPKKEEALKLGDELGKNRHVLKALESWPKTKLEVHKQIEALFPMVPADIQLLQLSYNHAFAMHGRDTVRDTRLVVSGKAVGTNAESNVQILTDRFRENQLFKTLVGTVDMTGSAYTGPEASPLDRSFNIRCDYKKRKFIP